MEKRCTKCRILYETSDLVCAGCGEAFEESIFLRWVAATMVVSAIFHFLLARLGVSGRGLFSEIMMTETLLILVMYGAFKLWQKLRAPQRQVFDEFASVYSDRGGRLFLAVVIVGSLWFWITSASLMLSGRPFAPKVGEPAWFTLFRGIRGYSLAGIIPLLAFFAAWRQGPRFFDFRAGSSFAPRNPQVTGSEE